MLQPDGGQGAGVPRTLSPRCADLGVVAAYGKILTDAVLAVPRLGMINVHASLLPRYRGAAPVHRAIINGDRETGVTIMRVVKALDAGPMLADVRRPIGADETSDEVERDLAGMGAELLVSSVDALAAGRAQETPQDDAAATYAPRLTKDDGLVDWAWPAQRIHNLIRGLHPWPHAFTFLGGQRFILRRSTTSAESAAAAPGTILEAAGDRLRVASGAGNLELVEIQAGRQTPMAVREFLAGHRSPRAMLPRTRMIGPARLAAFEILAAVSAGRADLPAALAVAREPPRRRARPGARRGNRHRRPAMARGARSPDRAVLQASRSSASIRKWSTILRLSTYQLLHLTRVPGVGRGRRCGGPDAAGGEAERGRFRQRRAADDLAPASCVAAAGAAARPVRSRRRRWTI